MSTDQGRSEEVMASYRQHKLARSALCRIHSLIQDFEKDDAFDRKMAVLGVFAILALIVGSLVLLFSGNGITLS